MIALLSGHVGDMAAAYLASDIVVSASTDPEAFRRVPPEAAAMGRAVIATDRGRARKTVLASSSLQAMRRRWWRRSPIFSHGRLRNWQPWAPKGRTHVSRRYAVERMCAETLALYRELIGTPA